MNQNPNPVNGQNPQTTVVPNGRPAVAPNGQNFAPSGAQQPPKVNNVSQFVQPANKPAGPAKKKKNIFSRELITIIGVLAIVAILYFTYNYQLNKNLEIVSSVPVAKEKIKPGTRITEEQIEYIDVPASTLRTVNALKNSQEIIGKYVNYDTIIPANSFHASTIMTK